MTRPSPKLFGAFVLGAIALVFTALLAFGAGGLFKDSDFAVSYFSSSIAGLEVGAPVTFRGAPIGTVTDIRISVDRRTLDADIPVYYEIDRSLITWVGDASISVEDRLDDAIRAGLRAQLVPESLVTGQLAIQLVNRPDTPAVKVAARAGVREIPAIPSEFDLIRSKLEEIEMAGLVASATQAVERLNQLLTLPEIRKMPVTLNTTLRDVDALITDLRVQLPSLFSEAEQTLQATQTTLRHGGGLLRAAGNEAGPLVDRLEATSNAAEATMRQAEATLASADDLLADDGPTYQDLQSTLEEVEAAARSIQSLAETIERNPTMFLRGR